MANDTSYTMWTKPMESWHKTPTGLEIDTAIKEEIKNCLSSNNSSITECEELSSSPLTDEAMRIVVR